MVKKVDALTAAQAVHLSAYARRWQAVPLSIGPADRRAFEASARRCYELAGFRWHGRVVWVGSPLILHAAAGTAAYLRQLQASHQDAEMGSIISAHVDSITGPLGNAQRNPGLPGLRNALRRAIGLALADPAPSPWRRVRRRLGRAWMGLREPGRPAFTPAHLRGHPGDYVEIGPEIIDRVRAAAEATRLALGPRAARAVASDFRLDSLQGIEVQQTIMTAIQRVGLALREEERVLRPHHVLGQPFANGVRWWKGFDIRQAMFTSFFREICSLELPEESWDLCRAYERTLAKGCWWYPHRDFLMVSEPPVALHRELSDRPVRAGRSQHQLHRTDGPAISWPDHWSIHALHGHVVPGWMVRHPERITVTSIEQEPNAEVRRAMLDSYGWTRYITESGAQVVDTVPMTHEIEGLRAARLLVKRLPGEPEPLVYLDMVNSTPEPDGSYRRYLERIDPNAYNGDSARFCHAAMASRWRHRDEDGQLQATFARWQDYRPVEES